jgi:hypothetical protein
MGLRLGDEYAIEFPETMKYRVRENTGYRVSMPQVDILAELQSIPTGRFTTYTPIIKSPTAKVNIKRTLGTKQLE